MTFFTPRPVRRTDAHSFHFQRCPSPLQLALKIALVCGAWTTAQAQTPLDTASNAVAVGTLQTVVVSGSRSEQLRDDLPLSMDVINASDLENQQIGDIKDLVKDLPNVSVKHAPARFTVTGAGNATGRDGNAGFNIRGLGGNRVLMLVDGIRLPSSYVNGNNAFGRDALSLDLLKRIELVRGPSSVLYGSDGLAGLVNFITYEPSDFLTTTDLAPKTLGGRVAARWHGDDNGLTLASTVAGRASDTVQWLITGTVNHAGGLTNMGNNDAADVDRTTPNPQTDRGNSLLGKLVLRPSASQKHVLTLERVEKDSDTELLSSRAKLPLTGTPAQMAAAVADESARETQRRERLTWDARYTLDTAWADHLQTVLSLQNTNAQDNGRTVRNDAGVRIRDTTYSEKTWQASVQASKTLPLSTQWSQRRIYGLDYVSTDVTTWFGGFDPAPLTPYVPKKYFPDSRESSAAVYVQNAFDSERWSVTPGLRLEHFSVDVISQAGYAPPATTPGISMSGFNTSPKLGALYRVTPEWSLFGNYTSGFRAPNAAQLNGYIDPSPFVNARLLPNPNLQPETSKNIELGVRARLARLSLDVAAFTGDFSQLIVDKKFLGGTNKPNDPNVFQTVNVDNATIWGFELHGSYDWGSLAGGRLSTPFAYGQARGTDNGTGRPLNSIDPALLTLGVNFETAAWSVRMDLRHHAAKNADDIDALAGVKTGNTQFIDVPAATTLDVSGQWRIRKDLRLTAGVVNLTNQKYWLWSDVQGLTAVNASTQADAYTQPGRHVNLSIVKDF